MSNNKWVNTSILVIIVATIFVVIYRPWTTSELTNNQRAIHDSYHNINIKTTNTKVEIVPTTQNQTTVSLSGNTQKRSKLTLDAKVKGQTLSVQVTRKKRFSLWFFNSFYNSTLTVSLPEKQYDSLVVDSKNGRIDLDRMLAETVKVETKNGGINVADTEATTISLDTKNGRIELSDVTAHTIDARSSNGRMVLDRVTGNITGKTSNGRISLTTDHLDQAISLTTSNGQINIVTNKEPTNTVIDVKTSNGKVDVFGHSNTYTTYGHGDHLIKLKTSNGRVSVNKR